MEKYKTVIIGSGCAGLSAAVYAARGNNSPVIIRGSEPGGQLTLTNEVANYPGFSSGISGPELITRMEEQAKRFGADIMTESVSGISRTSNDYITHLSSGDKIKSSAIIVASGSSARTLGVPGEDELMGKGVSTCATCDGAFFRGEDVMVVGGGDAACEEASFLTKFARNIYMVHRRDQLRAESYWKEQVEKHSNAGDIEILWNTEVTKVNGESSVDSVELVQNESGHPKEDIANSENITMDVSALFLAIGHVPNTGFLEDTGVSLSNRGYIDLDGGSQPMSTQTNVDGIFAAGDVFDSHYQQAVTAASSGVKAALDVDEYLTSKSSSS